MICDHARNISHRQRPCAGTTLSLLRPAAIRAGDASRFTPRQTPAGLSGGKSGRRRPPETTRADRMSAAAGQHSVPASLPQRPPALRQLMLEVEPVAVLPIRNAQRLPLFVGNGHCCVSAEYDEKGKHIHVFASHAEYPRCRKRCRSDASRRRGSSSRTMKSSSTSSPGTGHWPMPEARSRKIHSMLNEAGFPRPIRHIVVAVSGPGRDPGLGGMQHFTYEPTEIGISRK